MNKIFLFTFCLFTIIFYGQNNNKTINNFDFEIIENGVPEGWKIFGNGDYKAGIDTVNSLHGKKAATIEFGDGERGFYAWSYSLPANYQGKKIKLTGYIKTENVRDGYAGLWMRLDPSVGFYNMNDDGVTGTTPWKKYEIGMKLDLSQVKRIVVGGLLTGKGKMWIDNLKITIDGKKIEKVPAKELSKAEKDTAFINSSGIDTIILNDRKIEDLKILGLIWGFLKYYHPNIAAGNYNWDFELFRLLPQIIRSASSGERDKYLINQIIKLGEYKLVKKKKSEKHKIKINPDLEWINGLDLSDTLVTELLKVKNAKRTGKNYYIDLFMGVKNPVFNEVGYSGMKYPDAGYRLLSLYRYWNIIQYFFPYKNLIEEDWKDILYEFISKFINAANEIEYKLAVLELIAKVHDTHANIWMIDSTLTNYWGRNYAPVEITFIENKAVITGYYDEKLGRESGLLIGDYITKINDKSVNDILKGMLKYTPASNYTTQLREIAGKLLRTNDSTINVEYIRNGKSQTKTIKTFSEKEINIYGNYQNQDTCFKFINDEIAYLYLGSIKSNYLPAIFSKIKDTKGLVIDLRCYPSDFVVFSLGKYLVPNKTEFVKFSNGSIVKPGLFTFTKSIRVGSKNNKDYYKGRVVILVNENTQSQAEYTAMAFRVAPDAIVAGSTTAGADGNVSFFYLPGGIRTAISGIGVYYPDGSETQRIGIIPDIEIKPTIEGVKAGKDEVLDKAVELIEN